MFADASGNAPGAVAYPLWSKPEGPEARLASVKARVAPLRQSTIPQFALMAAIAVSTTSSSLSLLL